MQDLISGVDNGILIFGRGSYSIDQQRYNFQFGGQTFWEIKNGKVGGMLRDVAYQARTIDFWGSLDGLGGQATYEIPWLAERWQGRTRPIERCLARLPASESQERQRFKYRIGNECRANGG
jgi:hypothetical protein